MNIVDKINNIAGKEIKNEPYMLQGFVPGKAQQEVMCFGLGMKEDTHARLLWTIIAGADSSIQTIKTMIDGGYGRLTFGKGVKGDNKLNFEEFFTFYSEKGKYTTFPMNLGNKKAVAIIHEKLLEKEYVLSFDSAATDICELLKERFGLPMLDEWKEKIYKRILREKFITEIPVYYDENLFSKPVSLIKFKSELCEEEVDNVLSSMIQAKELCFPIEGNGEALERIPEDLSAYIESFSVSMLEKLSVELTPLHNPIEDETCKTFEKYPLELFPAQAHVATALSKFLLNQNAVLLQGKTSTGKTKMMTAIADALAFYQGKSGYRAIVYVPPSLTSKWAEKEIFSLIPHAEVHTIKRTEELIKWHNTWVNTGKPKAKKPTFFVVSFTTMRSGAAIEPVVQFMHKQTSVRKKESIEPYKYGWYCPTCMQAHQITESMDEFIDSDGTTKKNEKKRMMAYEEFGTSRRIDSAKKLTNAFCSECEESLWQHKVINRYGSFKEWANYERELSIAINSGEKFKVKEVQSNQPELRKNNRYPRRIATIDYIRRKMKNVFDIAIVDEVHECVTRFYISVYQ